MPPVIKVSWIQLQIPEYAPGQPPEGPCGCSCPPVNPPATSGKPIRYATGEPDVEAVDLMSAGYGLPWGHSRSFSSRLSENSRVGNGWNWLVREWTFLIRPDDTTVVIQRSALEPLWYDLVDGDYVGRHGIRESLIFNSGSFEYLLTAPDGSVTRYDGGTGAFLRQADPADNTLSVVSRALNGFCPTEVRRSVTVSGVTTIDSYLYSYTNPDSQEAQLDSVTLRRQMGGGSWTNITRAVYAYHAGGDSFGSAGDLKTVLIQQWTDGDWNDDSTTYYRYYTAPVSSSSSSSSSTSSGSSSSAIPDDPHLHLLKDVLNPSSYARMTADGYDPLTASDAVLALYADYHYEYDDNRRVTLERVQGSSQTYEFAFTNSEFSDDYNHWKTKSVETRPDGAQQIVYANFANQTMLMVLQSGGDQWCDFYRYNEDGRVILHAHPSAVSGFSEAYADLLHNTAGHFEYLHDHEGLIETTAYHAPSGNVAAQRIQQGQLGCCITLRESEYITCGCCSSSSSGSSTSSTSSGSSGTPTPSSEAIWFLSREIAYPDDGGCGCSGSSSSSSSAGPCSSWQNDGTRTIVTDYAYDWYPGTCAIREKTTTLPAIPADQNGTGVSATRGDYFDTFGNLTWQRDERGFLTRMTYDIPTGAHLQRIDDVDTSRVSDAPHGWTTPVGGGLHLITDFEHDDRGRIVQTLGPVHSINVDGLNVPARTAAWTVFEETNSANTARSARGYRILSGSSSSSGSSASVGSSSSSGSSSTPGVDPGDYLVNPVSITISDKKGLPLEQIQAVRGGTSASAPVVSPGKLLPTDTFPRTSYTRWTTHQYTDCCLAASMRVYHTIPLTGPGSNGANYDETDYGYDVLKRRTRTVTPGGTITDLVLDARGLALSTWIGTNDDGATDTDPSGGGLDPNNNMVVVSSNEYDQGQPGGDGNLTQQTQHVDASVTRVTSFLYDFRNRLTDTDGEIDLYEQRCYDNLDRTLRTDRRDTTANGHLIARGETRFDDRGRVYQSLRYAVDPSTGAVGNALTDNTWFDASGNTIKSLPSGSNLFTKTVYDSLGRATIRYLGYDLDETTAADAASVDDDVILEQTETAYDDASNALVSTVRQRYHNAPDSETGPLADPETAPKARVSSSASWFDGIGRTVATAAYGTFGGIPFVRPADIPDSTDDGLVSFSEFNARGEPFLQTDPAGMVTRTTSDDAGRRIEVIENFQALSSSSSSGAGSSSSASGGGDCDPSDDKNRTTRFSYTPDGNLATLTAVNPITGDQVTTYTYGTTLDDSELAASTLLRETAYPDSVGGSDVVAQSYNRQGEPITIADQRGMVRTLDRDLLGRLIHDRVTAVGSLADTAVLRLSTAYDVRSQPETLSSYDDPDVGSGTLVNQVQFAYNPFGQPVQDQQAHSGGVTP